jgi:hypothetical protein
MYYNKQLQLTIDISTMNINWILNQLSNVVSNLFTMVCLLIGKPSKEWIVVPPINKGEFSMYVVMWSFCHFSFWKNIIG